MNLATPREQKYRLTASNIAAYFKHRCDRNFRWNTVEATYRGKTGIGWNVPHKVRAHSRPGIALLMREGNTFEADNVESYVAAFGEHAVLTEGVEEKDGRRKVIDLKFEKFADAVSAATPPQFVAQLEVELEPEQQATLIEYFGLDPRRVKLGVVLQKISFPTRYCNDATRFSTTNCGQNIICNTTLKASIGFGASSNDETRFPTEHRFLFNPADTFSKVKARFDTPENNYQSCQKFMGEYQGLSYEKLLGMAGAELWVAYILQRKRYGF